MTTYDPFSSPHVGAALYFTDQGQYLFKSKEKGGCTSKTLREPEVCAAFTRKGFDSGWLDSGILRTGNNPKGKWFVYLSTPKNVVIDLTGNEYLYIPTPMMLMIGADKSHFLFAMNIFFVDQFKPDLPVFVAPFPNVRHDGEICWGNNDQPKVEASKARDTLKQFFASPFNGDLANGKSKKYELDVRKMLEELDFGGDYPVDDLVHTQMNVNQLVKRLIGRELE